MTTLTVRRIKDHFVVTGPDIEPMQFKSRPEARDWCRSHYQAQELAHEMILEVRDDHLEVIQVRFGSDESGNIVDHKGVVAPGQPVTEIGRDASMRPRRHRASTAGGVP